MSTQRKIWQLAEGYVNGTLSAYDLRELDKRRMNDPAFASDFEDCLNLLSTLKSNKQRHEFRSILKNVHADVSKEQKKERSTRIISLVQNYWRTAVIAASIALCTSVGTFWLMQYNNKRIASQYSVLRKDLEKYKRSQNRILNDIKQQSRPAIQANYSGTGFALAPGGYVVTNYHVVAGADSLYIQDMNGNYFKAYPVAFNEVLDISILKAEDEEGLLNTNDIPYTITTEKGTLGAHVFTLGFPQDEIVYNEGYISSKNGYSGDSSQFRLEIPAGPGQSGAPVVDATGNIIGLITGKETASQGITYAVSANTIIELLENLPDEVNIKLPTHNKISRLSRQNQIELLEKYTYSIKVYNQ